MTLRTTVLLLFFLHFAFLDSSDAAPAPEQYSVPKIIQTRYRVSDFKDDSDRRILSSVNEPDTHQEKTTLVIKPEATTFLDILAPYYLTLQRQNFEQETGPVVFTYPTQSSVNFAGVFNKPREYPQPQPVQKLDLQAPSPSTKIELAPAVNVESAPLNRVQIVPAVAVPTNTVAPIRQNFNDPTIATNLPMLFTLPTIPPVVLPVISQLKQSFDEETSPATLPPIVTETSAPVESSTNTPAPTNPAAVTSAPPPPVTESTLPPVTEAVTSSPPTTEPTTAVTLSPIRGSYIAAISGNGYALEPTYNYNAFNGFHEKNNLPLSFKSVGAQFDRFFSSVDMKELIKSGQNVLDLGAQGLGHLFGLKNPTNIQPTIGFGLLGKRR